MARPADRPFVGISEIAVPPEGDGAMQVAFHDRLRAVDGWPGFSGLELLQDRRRPGRYLMITRWQRKAQFLAYMRSDDHRRSHQRIDRGPAGPRPAGFTEYDLVAE
ncbi:MAG: antibiotic biosynthesis monooxygenase [Candidatus Dormibacteraeota bacterium]|nr:antibiotic biosynthesis monooxygenase [Candidatus Dormibacteraeota bacterium]